MVNFFFKAENNSDNRGLMKKIALRFCLVFILIVSVIHTQNNLYAQDEGEPALKKLAIFSVGGAAGGAVLGVAFWMLDPLAPDNDIRINAINGMGLGVIAGFVFGVMQLNKQALLPYTEPDFMMQEDEFSYVPNYRIYEYGMTDLGRKRKNQRISLFQFQLRF